MTGALMVMGSQVAGGIGGGGTGGGSSGGGTGGGGGAGEEGGPLSVEIGATEGASVYMALVDGGVAPFTFAWSVVSGTVSCAAPTDEVVNTVTGISGASGTIKVDVADANAQSAFATLAVVIS
jgi:hypothetical protein